MTANRFYLTYKCNAENLMLKKGIYQHYKGQLYQVLHVATALLHKDLKCKAPLIEPNLRRNLGKWST